MDDPSLSSTGFPFASRPRVARLLLLLLSLLAFALWFSSRALLTANFLPHWYCYAGNTRLLWTTVLGDLFIGLSYVLISATLVHIIRRAGQDLPYQGFFWAFGLFIVSCGLTHFLEIVTVWQPVYWLAAAAKILTAVSSVGTAIVFFAAAEDIASFARAVRLASSQRGQQQLRALYMATPMAVLSFDLDGLITSWNPGAEKIFGFRESDVLGKPSPIVPTELRNEHQSLQKSTRSGSVTRNYETSRKRADGRVIPVSISSAPLYSQDGRQTGIMAVIEDISERKRIELELLQKSAILLTVTHALNIYLDSADWNLAARELLSFATTQTGSDCGYLGVLIDESRLQILAADDTRLELSIDPRSVDPFTDQNSAPIQPRLQNLFSQIILSGNTVIENRPVNGFAMTGLPADHPPLECFLGVPIYKGNNVAGLIAVANHTGGYTGEEWRPLETMSRAIGILYDNYRQSLTRSAVEEKQAALEAHLRQSQNLELLARVAGGFAHDFNNMLMILSGASELLDRSLGPESLSRVYVEQIQRSTAKAAAITRQLLAFSRKQVLDIQPMDLHAALSEAKSMLAHVLPSSVELEFTPLAACSWIRSDLPQIVQVILNLSNNSRDAMPAGGRLTISTRNAEKPPALAPTAAAEIADWVVLEVRDTGIGMDKKTLPQIFEPFFTTKPVGKGTGLGLSTVYGVARQSGGYIDVHSEPGQGAFFELYFPVIAVPLPSPETPFADSEDAPRNSATILLVDDESALVHAIGEFLRESGYIVLDAFSSQDALDLAKEYPGTIDLLVSDVIMPGLRGPDLHRQILEFQPGIQVLFMSGYAEGLAEMALPPGALFLQKPFRFSTLLSSVRQLQSRI
jgi:PAS domain S-box-containing protein